MAGTLVLTDTVSKTFDNLFADVYRGTDAVVRAKARFDGPAEHGRRSAAVSTPSLLRHRRAGRRRRRGRGQRLRLRAARSARTASRSATRPTGAPTFGGNWSDSKELNPFTLVAGRAPRGRRRGRDRQEERERRATSRSATPPPCSCRARPARFTSSASPSSAPPTARAAPRSSCSPRPRRSGSSPSRASSTPSRSWPANGRLPDGDRRAGSSRCSRVAPRRSPAQQITKETQERHPARRLSFFTTFMLVFAVVALLVGAFMIFNTFSITVAQRTRENALLRALGASKRQVLASVLLEALAVGLARVAGRPCRRRRGRGRPEGDARRVRVRHPGRRRRVHAQHRDRLDRRRCHHDTASPPSSPARKAGKVPPVAAMRERRRREARATGRRSA